MSLDGRRRKRGREGEKEEGRESGSNGAKTLTAKSLLNYTREGKKAC